MKVTQMLRLTLLLTGCLGPRHQADSFIPQLKSLALAKLSRQLRGGQERNGYNEKERNKKVSTLSLKQLFEFSQFGKFQLGQIRSQLDYESFMKNYDMNIKFQLRKFGLLPAIPRSENNTLCYDVIGCVEITEKWYDLMRPVNLLPLDRDIINTQFILRTRDNLQERILQLNKKGSLLKDGFQPGNPVKILIHGFIDTGFEPWVKDLSEALLEEADCNVIAVDWGGGSLPLYSQAAANTRLVGLEVAHLIQTLMTQYNVSGGQVHIIGHSLGAHIAGYAGERVRVARITGLDPAEPLFQDMPTFVRLDPTDADFVDVIHTDSKSIMMGGYGMKQEVGHVDFYPNGGDSQPGCSLLDLPSLTSLAIEDISLPTAGTVGRRLVACGHNRAIDLYIDSIRRWRSCPMIGQLCGGYDQYLAGGCLACEDPGDRCALMGYHAKKHRLWRAGQNRRMYLNTGPAEPYCLHSYLLELKLAKPRESEQWVQGTINVNLYGDKGEITDLKLNKDETSQRFVHGEKTNFLIELEKDVGVVSIVHVFWEYDHQVDPFDLKKICLLFCSDSLYVDSIAMTSVVLDREGQPRSRRKELYGEEEEDQGSHTLIQSGQWKLFYREPRPGLH